MLNELLFLGNQIQMSTLIAPSILSADFANLQKEVEMINVSQADWVHIDVMDGVFVPNITMGIPVVKAIAKYSKKPLDVHLMIVEPDRYVEEFTKAGAASISIHLEACNHLHRNIQQIKNLGIKVGIAINPHTSVLMLENIICDIDLVCLMAVNPGFGGQKFIEATYPKVQALRQLINRTGSLAKIEVDGGVNSDNAKYLIEAGADILVAGNSVFNSQNPMDVIAQLKHL